MYSPYVDFINHGILPFVGRSSHAEHIIEFWRTSVDVQQLRAMLITGEAGIGKSRLIEEVIPQILQAGGAIVHTKLYPESTTSIAPLLARALRFMNMRRSLLLSDPDDTLLSVASALRRLSQLRRTLLVIEDIHLLGSETLRELALLLDSIADEPILALCTSRPLGTTARGILERYLIEENELKGLDQACLATVWKTLFATDLDPIAIAHIWDVTLGNPLAIRSALRGAIKSGVLTRDTTTNVWRPAIDIDSFRKSLTRNIELLSEGMAAHLSEAEKKAAEKLALLGEVFGREAAHELLGNADEMIDGLIFKGILVLSNTAASPISGSTDTSSPLAFTHTLLHRRFVEQARAEHSTLIRLVASGIPIYSVLPFRHLAAREPDTSMPIEVVEQAIERSLRVARSLDRTADWELSLSIWQAAADLSALNRERWDATTGLEWELRLLMQRLALLRREEAGDDYGRTTARMLELTEEPLPPSLRKYRLLALVYKDIHLARHGSSSDEVRNQIEELVARFPALRFTQGYVFYLIQLAHGSQLDKKTLEMVEERIDAILESDEATEEFRTEVRFRIFPVLLLAFDTREQLDRRMEFLTEFEAISRSHNLFNDRTLVMHFLVSVGRFVEASAIIDELLPRLRERGLTRSYSSCLLNKLCIQIAFGKDTATVAAEIEQCFASVPEDFMDAFSEHVTAHLFRLAILLDDLDLGRRVVAGLPGRDHPIPFAANIVVSLSEQGIEGLRTLPAAGPTEEPSTAMREFLDALLATDPSDPTSCVDTAIRVLRRDILRLDDLVCIHAVLLAIEAADTSLAPGLRDALRNEAAIAIDASLEWLAERALPPLMRPLLKRFHEYLESGAATAWEQRIDEIEGTRRETVTDQRRSKDIALTIRMLGTIEAERPDGEKIPIRGSRLRTLLGLMVADGILDEPLAYREFSSIIAGVDDDPDRARRMLNGVVFRLRELLGHEAILTDTETPRLNRDRIEVDLFEAHQLLRKTADALQNGSLIGARYALIEALDIMRGEVPFPMLYDNFFEAVRDDLENQQRTLILKIAQGLLTEKDPLSAEQILQRGFRAMPEDEEIADLLCSTLVKLGKRAQSERIRMRNLEMMAV